MTSSVPDKNCLCGGKALLVCGLCRDLYCKKCTEFLAQDTFSFMGKIPKDLTHTHYCFGCYSRSIQPALRAYNEVMRRAKAVMILDKPRRRPLTILKKFPEPLEVVDCPDREETVLRLAFKAAELGFNSVIRANINYKKVGSSSYQKLIWHGSGIAADLDDRKLD